MKKIYFLLGVCSVLGACTKNLPTTVNYTEPTLVINQTYADDADRYRQNISVKEEGDGFVTYEYKDVCIDEVATLAIVYCQEKAPTTAAHLREIVLYRNNARRATFDCLNLAKE